MAGVAPPPLAALARAAGAAADVDSEAAEARRHVNPAVIRSAAERIRNDIRRTPLWRLPGAALGIGCAEVWLKLEHLQVSGSFKARGMFNRLRSHKVPAAGVIIASGGNAGIAVAVAARALGVRCEVFVPEVTPPSKRQRLLDAGATMTVTGRSYAEAAEACIERQQASGALLMHAYDQQEVIAGAGTLAMEIEAEAGVPDRVLVSVGGGGLIAGIAAWFEGCTRVESMEPQAAPTLHAALSRGEPVAVDVAGIAADSLGARRIGSLAWPICRQHVVASYLLPDEIIAAAQARMWSDLRLAVEPAAALPLGALWAGAVQPAPDERVAVVICGANFDPAALG
ncbi:MAG: threonine/serine dehydratase [Rubrivivax sp.]